MAAPVKALLLPVDVARALGAYLMQQRMVDVEAFVAAIRAAPIVDVKDEAPPVAAPAPSAPPMLRAVPDSGRAQAIQEMLVDP